MLVRSNVPIHLAFDIPLDQVATFRLSQPVRIAMMMLFREMDGQKFDYDTLMPVK